MTKLTQDTRAVRAGLENCDVTGAVVPPLHLSSTYAFRGFGDKRKYDYSRSGNPTRDLLAEALADLEGGAGAVITGSGMRRLIDEYRNEAVLQAVGSKDVRELGADHGMDAEVQQRPGRVLAR